MDFTKYAGNNSKDCDLCKQVMKRLGQDKISECLRNELIQVNGNLAEATVEYFKYRFIFDCVKKFLDIKVSKKTKNKEQVILSDPLYLTLVKKYSSADGVQVFGITEDFIDKTIKKKQKNQLEKEELNKFVEDETDSFCAKISEYAGYAQKYRGNARKAFQESVKVLSAEFDNLAVTKYKLESDEEEIKNLISSYFENLLHGVSMMKSLVTLYKKKLEFQSSLGNLYVSRQKTLASKINHFEHKILVATYHKKSIQALTIIREELDQKKYILDRDLNRTNSELQSYRILGPEYQKLVDEYTDLLKQVQHQKWANESLKRRKSFGGSLSDTEELTTSFEQEERGLDCSILDNAEDCSKLGETSVCSKFDETSNNTIIEKTMSVTMIADTANRSKLYETVDCAKLDETVDCAKLDQTVDCAKLDKSVGCANLDETVYCAKQGETVDCSKLNETVDCSKVDETVNSSKLDETVDCTKLDFIEDSSKLGETPYCSKLNETSDNTEITEAVDDTKIDKKVDCSKLDTTMDFSNLDTTVDCSKLTQAEKKEDR